MIIKMDLNKHLEFFNPMTLTDSIHIIGCGAMGSRIAEQLVRLGCTDIHLWDFDIVTPHNITNQLYRHKDIDIPKVGALAEILLEINPQVKITGHNKRYESQSLSGYIFLCVDSIETRYKIAKENEQNKNIIAMFDTRMRLEDAQSYAADWTDSQQKKMFLNTMMFTDEEARKATPVSACGTTLSVAPTVITTAALTISNMINFVKTKKLQSIILVDTFNYTLMVY